MDKVTIDISVGMKVGILHTIAESIYESPERKIREAVANSVDNGASLFVIFADPSTKTLSLFDNGRGITEERFKEIFTNLGYGLSKDELHSLSHFGLGLMSIIRLGKKAKIYTRSIKEKKLLRLSINTEKIFDKSNEKQSLNFIEQCVSLSETDLVSRHADSPLTNSDVEQLLGVFPESFTEIVIEDVIPQDLEFVRGDAFEGTVRKFLPLKVDEKDPFLQRIKDREAKEWLDQLFVAERFFPTIDFYYGVDGEKELKQLWKYFPDFKKEWEFGKTSISYGIKEDFAYYILYTVGALQEEIADVGFWVRNRNFLVKAADFFQRPGHRKKILHEPLKNWIYAEIFHENMNDFLMVSRNEYIWDSQKFKDFYSEIDNLVSHLNKELRQAYEYGNRIVEAVITPFKEVEEKSGPFHRASKTISEMGIPCDGEDATGVLEKLKKKRKPELEKEDNRIDRLVRKGYGKVTLADNEQSVVVIDMSVSDKDVFTKTWDPQTKRIIINISPSLFSPKRVIFLNKTFDVFFVAANQSDPGVSIDVDNGKIFVNPFNHDFLNYTVSFLDIYIAVELADAVTETKEEMKQSLLRLLGMKFSSVTEYFSPLADDLQRKKRSR